MTEVKEYVQGGNTDISPIPAAHFPRLMKCPAKHVWFGWQLCLWSAVLSDLYCLC